MGNHDNHNKNGLPSKSAVTASPTTPAASRVLRPLLFLTIDSDNDKELEVAKEMAMAIAPNHNLTPSKIEKMGQHCQEPHQQ
jgi:hypothetical protein